MKIHDYLIINGFEFRIGESSVKRGYYYTKPSTYIYNDIEIHYLENTLCGFKCWVDGNLLFSFPIFILSNKTIKYITDITDISEFIIWFRDNKFGKLTK